MKKTFQQKNNLILAISFVGLIIVSQLLVLNMGYNIPGYFLAILVILCGIIFWSMIDTKCIIEKGKLTSKVGPFVQKIDLSSMDKVIVSNKRSVGSLRKVEKVWMHYAGGKKLDFSPADMDGFLDALRQQNQKINIERND